MSRFADLMFKMINAGEITPDEALAEARSPHCPDDAAQLLITWAWGKQDEAHRIELQRRDEIDQAIDRALHNALFYARQAHFDANPTTGEEPF